MCSKPICRRRAETWPLLQLVTKPAPLAGQVARTLFGAGGSRVTTSQKHPKTVSAVIHVAGIHAASSVQSITTSVPPSEAFFVPNDGCGQRLRLNDIRHASDSPFKKLKKISAGQAIDRASLLSVLIESERFGHGKVRIVGSKAWSFMGLALRTQVPCRRHWR